VISLNSQQRGARSWQSTECIGPVSILSFLFFDSLPGASIQLLKCKLRSSVFSSPFLSSFYGAPILSRPCLLLAPKGTALSRTILQHFVGLSFPTISSIGSNAAIIHYGPQRKTCADFDPSKIYLCDSGAQVRPFLPRASVTESVLGKGGSALLQML
jgi:hypothetical protein